MLFRTAIFAFATGAALCAAQPAMAQNPFGDLRNSYSAEEARDAQRSGEVLIRSRDARMIALSQYPGSEYLDMFLTEDSGRPVYVVRLKTADGRRVEVLLDARTGSVLRGGRN